MVLFFENATQAKWMCGLSLDSRTQVKWSSGLSLVV